MAFADTDKTVFVGRREDGTIYGLWQVRQWNGHEERLEDEPEIVAFVNRPKRKAGDPKPTSPIIDPRINKSGV